MALRVPPRFQEATLSMIDREQFSSVVSYAENMKSRLIEGVGLILSGPPGVGKSFAMAALTRTFIEFRGRSPHDHEFVTAPDMFDNLDDFSDKWDEWRDCSWIETYASIPWLVINDLSKEYRGGKLVEQVSYKLGRILRARSEKKRVTHITTNATGKELKATYGDSITSLMLEMMRTVVVGGRDRRGPR